jgi:hypothetical protein
LLINNQKRKIMSYIQNTKAKINANPISTLVGVVGAFYLAKKFMPTSKWYVLGGIALAGGLAGAMISSTIASKGSAPTKTLVTTPIV